MEKLARVPPENTSNKDSNGLPKKSACSDARSIPAAGMWAISLNTTSIKAVIITFRLISGDLINFAKNWEMVENIHLLSNYFSSGFLDFF